MEKRDKPILLFLPQKWLPEAREHMGEIMSGVTEEFGLIQVPAGMGKIGLKPLRMGRLLARHVLPAWDMGQCLELVINKSILKCLTPTVNLSFLEHNWLRRNVRK